LISVIEEINDEVEKCAGGAGTNRGTGGMVTKLQAAKIAMNAGIDLVLINGQHPELIMDVIEGADVGTLFKAASDSRNNR
jgi:glutamate 5-kinase